MIGCVDGLSRDARDAAVDIGRAVTRVRDEDEMLVFAAYDVLAVVEICILQAVKTTGGVSARVRFPIRIRIGVGDCQC